MGKLGVGRFEIQVVANVSEIGLPRSNSLSGFDRFTQGEMGGMRLVTQPIQDERIEAFEKRPALWRNLVGVRAVGHAADSKSEHLESWPVEQPDRLHRGAKKLKRFRPDGVEFQLRNGASVGWLEVGERVIVGFSNSGLDARLAVNGHRVSKIERQEAKII